MDPDQAQAQATAAKHTETALLTEHLRYTPLTLLDDIINTINELSYKAINAVESGLLSANPAQLGFDRKYAAEKRVPPKDPETGKSVYPEARQEIEEGLHKLETLLETNIDRNFDKMEIIVLRSILSVPSDLVPWIRLRHYGNIPDEIAEGKGLTTAEVEQLRLRVRETRKLNRMLNHELAKSKATNEQLRSLLSVNAEGHQGALAFLNSGEQARQLGLPSTLGETTGAEKGPLETNVNFALSQLPALKELVASLRPQLAKVKSEKNVPAPEAEEERERRLYVERQARMAMERQGLMPEHGSEELPGKAVSERELASLEAMVGSRKESSHNDSG